MQFSIPSKLPNVGINIFSAMSQLAQLHQAVNLSQGFPDFPCDERLIGLVAHYMKQGKNQYAPMQGTPELRSAIAEKFRYLYNAHYNVDTEVTVTSGGSEAVFSIIASIIHAGDEVIIFEPAYDLYRPIVEMQGGVVQAVTLHAPTFTIDWELVKKMVSPKTKMIIINNPNNPSTQTLKEADLQALCSITENTGIIILSDEVYEHIVFDDQPFLSVCKYPILKERSFIVASFGKLLHTTGWKMGYCVAPDYLMKEFRKVHQFNVFSVHTPSQYAIADYLEDRNTYLDLSRFFQEKRDYFLNALQSSRFDFIPSQGTYFLLASYARISDESDLTFAENMTIEHKVATIPVSAFYEATEDTGLIRFCFAKKKETLDLAIEKLLKM